MRRIEVKVDDRFGRLTVIGEARRSDEHRKISCVCDCGESVVVALSSLRTRLTTSCGCWRKERATIHGMQNTAEYRAWKKMLQRCYYRGQRGYHNYGGRGIEVCEEWKTSFQVFYAHVGKRPSAKHSLDRFPNNNGNYEPGNVRWATMSEQHLNSRRSRSARGLPAASPRRRIRVARHIAQVFKPA